MKALTIIQHTSSDHLGLIEDHLEARQIRFRYVRPFSAGSRVPSLGEVGDGLVLLGGGPWGTAGEQNVPTLDKELELARHCLMSNKLIIGIGLGAQILALAADGSTRATPLELRTGEGLRTIEGALNGYLPERFPYATYMRDWPVPPSYARILAKTEQGEPLIFQMGDTAFGFAFHPGFKLAIAEDLVMEFEEAPEGTADSLTQARAVSRHIEDSLVPIMTGLVQVTGLMETE
ncbi:MAG: hypothetical protein R3C13_10500 [Hyphomonas sp.]|uniref:hypothetical protein n=1 Tax=Hyphomonas sp. TaxID=87 RepID=UPI0035292973